MIIKGKVIQGLGEADFWVKKIENIFYQKTNMKLFYGTLNVKLQEPYIIDDISFYIKPEEYGGTEFVLVKKCNINDKEGYILRTKSNNVNKGTQSNDVIEIVSNVKLRDKFNLKDGDIISIRNKIMLKIPFKMKITF